MHLGYNSPVDLNYPHICNDIIDVQDIVPLAMLFDMGDCGGVNF